MDVSSPTGSRIRSYRIEKGIRQADLARDCEISPSYLNLIEHNRRRIGGVLLLRLSSALGIEPDRLSEGADLGVAMALSEAAQVFPESDAEVARSSEFANRFPGWARLIAALYGERSRLEETIARLDKRLTHDPYLAASMHTILSSVTSIRSSSAILANGEDVGPEWEARFQRNIFEDSQRLSETTEDLVRFLENETETELPVLTAQEEVDAWLTARQWRIAELEAEPDADDADLWRLVRAAGELTDDASRAYAVELLGIYASDVRLLPEVVLRDALEDTVITPLTLAEHLGVAPTVLFRRLASRSREEMGERGGTGLFACDGEGTLIFRKPLDGFDWGGARISEMLWPLFQAMERPLIPVTRLFQADTGEAEKVRATAVSEISFPDGYGNKPKHTAWMLLEQVIAPVETATSRAASAFDKTGIVG